MLWGFVVFSEEKLRHEGCQGDSNGRHHKGKLGEEGFDRRLVFGHKGGWEFPPAHCVPIANEETNHSKQRVPNENNIKDKPTKRRSETKSLPIAKRASTKVCRFYCGTQSPLCKSIAIHTCHFAEPQFFPPDFSSWMFCLRRHLPRDSWPPGSPFGSFVWSRLPALPGDLPFGDRSLP